jgi:hypothetical protein
LAGTHAVDDYGFATITGDVIGTAGATVLQGTANGAEGQRLIIDGTVTLRDTGTSYDSITLAKVELLDEFAFDVTTDTVTLGATGILTGSGGTTVKNLITKSASGLAIGTIGTLTAVDGLNLNGVTLDGTNGLTEGTLTLATRSRLAIGNTGVFNVAEDAILDVGSGTIGLANAITSMVTVAADSGTAGTLKFGDYEIVGLAGAVGNTNAYAVGTDIAFSDTPTNDIWYASTTVGGTTASPGGQGAASTVDITAGAVSVLGNAGGPTTITSATRLIRYEP